MKTLNDTKYCDKNRCCIYDHKLQLQTFAREWIESKESECTEGDNHTKEWIKHFFNLEVKK